MRISAGWLKREVAFGLVMMLAMPLAEAAELPQEGISGQPVQGLPSVPSESQSPGSRGVNVAPDTNRSDDMLPDSPSPNKSQSAAQSGQPTTSQSVPEQQQETTQKPVGSAAAPYEKTTGVAASSPAGAVIAPAKQRRARAIFIRVSIVVGAAVAIGTVVALSHGSPSRPN